MMPVAPCGIVRSKSAVLLLVTSDYDQRIEVKSWALPAINPWIGYKDLCQQAQTLAERKGTTNFAAWNVRRAENIDAYLGKQVEIIPDAEEAKTHLLHNTVLMLPVSSLSSFEGKESWAVGKYAVIFLE